MNRIATMTVVRGDGECMAIVNGVVQSEIQRLRRKDIERNEIERAEMRKTVDTANAERDTIRKIHSRMLREQLEMIRNPRKMGRFERFKYRVSEFFDTSWCVLVGTFLVLIGRA